MASSYAPMSPSGRREHVRLQLCSGGQPEAWQNHEGQHALRYVGGEHRVLKVKRTITYSDLVYSLVERRGYGAESGGMISLKYPDGADLISITRQDELEEAFEFLEDSGERALRVFVLDASGGAETWTPGTPRTWDSISLPSDSSDDGEGSGWGETSPRETMRRLREIDAQELHDKQMQEVVDAIEELDAEREEVDEPSDRPGGGGRWLEGLDDEVEQLEARSPPPTGRPSLAAAAPPSPATLASAASVPLSIDADLIDAAQIEMKEEVGRGAFGTVHRAKWLGKGVCVKVLRYVAAQADVTAEAEFRHEARLLAQLKHPNIVQYLGVARDDDRLMLVTEDVHPGNLTKQLSHDHAKLAGGRKPQFTWARRLRIAVGVAQGMAYLHSKNVGHFDLKTANLLCTTTYDVKIADFGLSRTGIPSLSAGGVETTGRPRGTPHYMAPELVKSAPFGLSVDVFAFGVVVWELATRRLPFRQVADNLIPIWIAEGKRADIPATCPKALGVLIERCWHQDARERPSFLRCVEVLQQLQRAQKDSAWQWPEDLEAPEAEAPEIEEEEPFNDEVGWGGGVNREDLQLTLDV